MGLKFSIFMVLHKKNVHRKKEIFEFVSQLHPEMGVAINPLYLKYNLMKESYMISNDEYFEFMKDLYLYMKQNKIELRNNILSNIEDGLFNNRIPRLCHFSNRCNSFISVSENGDLYSTCYFKNEYYLGNINKTSFEDIFLQHIKNNEEINNNILSKKTMFELLGKNEKFKYFQGKGCTKRSKNKVDYYMETMLKLIKYISQYDGGIYENNSVN